MTLANKIAFLVCENYAEEVRKALASEKLGDAVLATFPARCGHPPLEAEEIRAILDGLGDVQRVEILGGCCLHNLRNWAGQTHVHKLDLCFELVADREAIDRLLNAGAYLTTPGWLANWPSRLEHMGLDQKLARELFQETASRIVLLDTGTDPRSEANLQDFSRHVGQSCETWFVGLSSLRLRLCRSVLTWRLEAQKRVSASALQTSATHAMAIDLLSNLARIVDENRAIEGMLDVYGMLFAPRSLYYLSFRDNEPVSLWARPTQPEGAEKAAIMERLSDPSLESGLSQDGRSFILRIDRHGRIMGIVAVEDIAFPEYHDLYLNLALSIKDICDLPIENARKYQKLVQTEDLLRKANAQLSHLASTDQLTGIANRRAYDERLDSEWKRMQRNGSPLSLIVCDIDFFKRFNDNYGHKEGDTCLHDVAQTILGAVSRPGDFVARYGGEEFAVILPDTGGEGALFIAEKIRTAVLERQIPHAYSDAGPYVTLSLGVAEATLPLVAGHPPSALFHAADAGLYRAKTQGRNRALLQEIAPGSAPERQDPSAT